MFVFLRLDSPSGPKPLHHWGFEITLRHTTLGRTPLDKWSTSRTDLWQHTTLATDRYSCPQWDSNPQSQHASGRRPTLQTARPPGSAWTKHGTMSAAYWLNQVPRENRGVRNYRRACSVQPALLCRRISVTQDQQLPPSDKRLTLHLTYQQVA